VHCSSAACVVQQALLAVPNGMPHHTAAPMHTTHPALCNTQGHMLLLYICYRSCVYHSLTCPIYAAKGGRCTDKKTSVLIQQAQARRITESHPLAIVRKLDLQETPAHPCMAQNTTWIHTPKDKQHLHPNTWLYKPASTERPVGIPVCMAGSHNLHTL
jgi:hypothetical protein